MWVTGDPANSATRAGELGVDHYPVGVANGRLGHVILQEARVGPWGHDPPGHQVPQPPTACGPWQYSIISSNPWRCAPPGQRKYPEKEVPHHQVVQDHNAAVLS